MSANPAIPQFDFDSLLSIDALDLDGVLGGAGWGETIGRYAGAAVGGGLGAAAGGAAFSWTGPGAVIAGGALGGAGAAAGYDAGGRIGSWLTGGR